MFAKLGLRVRFRMAAKVKAHTPVVLVLTVDKAFNIRTHVAATDGITTRSAAAVSAGSAVAVGLPVVGMIPEFAITEVQVLHVVVHVARKMCKMMSVAARVEVLAVIVQGQMVAHVVLQVVKRMLVLHDKTHC